MKASSGIALIAVLVVGAVAVGKWRGDTGTLPSSAKASEPITRTISVYRGGIVTKVSDGDTLHVLYPGSINPLCCYGAVKTDVVVRVLGVDTPETRDPRKPVQCYGKEASDFTKRFAVGHVTFTTEPSSGDEKDRYGRTIAYVYLLAHRSDLGAALLRRGLGRVYAFENRHFARRAKYEALQARAKSKRVGLWGNC